jgi:serine/threonine protein kinase
LAEQPLKGTQGAAAAAPASSKPPVPEKIGPYRVACELGRGAFGVVFQGFDEALKREVAIKVLNRGAIGSARAVERFLREAQVVAGLHHNHIVPVYQLGEHEGGFYIASRLIRGVTLSDIIPANGMPSASAVELLLALLDALAYAHDHGVIHRDVKPDNVLVDVSGQLHLTDFGLAGFLGGAQMTQDGALLGTPSYMAPEQTLGKQGVVGAAADQYAAGVVLYELLTGHLPFEGGPLSVLIHNIQHTPPPPLTELHPGLKASLQSICLKALAKRAEDRFVDCRAMARALRDWQSEVEVPPPPTVGLPANRPVADVPDVKDRRSPSPRPGPAPLVRRRGTDPPGETASLSSTHASDTGAAIRPTSAPGQDRPAHQPRGKMAGWVILSSGIVTALVLCLFGYFGVRSWHDQAEERLRKEADGQYRSGLFRDAGQRYKELSEKFPSSEHAPFYRFREVLSEVRRHVGDRPESPVELLDRIGLFIADNKKSPLLAEHGRDIGDTLVKLLVDWCAVVGVPSDDKPLAVLDHAAPVVAEAKAIPLPNGGAPADWAKLEAASVKLKTALDKARRDVALTERRNSVIKRLEKLAGDPSARSLLAFEALVRREEAELPGLANLPRVKNLKEALFDGHLRRVEYVRDPPPPARTGAGEETEPTILFDPLIHGAPGGSPRGDPIVLALVRGVLYALKQSTGEVKWATRVGVDTTALPVRVPADIGSTERILVLSSDTSTLTALDTDGRPLWRHALGAPVLGKPVVVDQRAYLVNYSGEIHEIELVAGKLVGVYRLGGTLSLGGTHEPGTKRIYFPADEGCVYVLDVGAQKCEMILYSRHPAGSLRCEPIIVTGRRLAPRYLILNQTNGLRGVQLRVFDLPLADRQARDRVLNPKANLEGWTWFRPYQDPEKLVMVSDAGMLGLFGIRHPNSLDQPLYPMLPRGSLTLAPLLGVSSRSARMRSRAEVVQVQGDDLWVLASDQLQRLRLARGLREGPRVVPLWDKPQLETLRLGSPLHRSQVVEDRTGRTSLVLVTQPPHRSTCWATCADDESGAVRWQRQLGLVCVRSPLPIPLANAPPLFLGVDHGGSLFSIDPTRKAVKPGTLLSGAASLDESSRQEPVVLPGGDGKSVYVIASPGGRHELVVRHVTPGSGRSLRMEESRAPLPATLGGTPAAVGSRLVVPLANGTLVRVPLPPLDPPHTPKWRDEDASPESQGHVVAVSDDRFLTTDGRRGLLCWKWPAGATNFIEQMPRVRESDLPTLQLSSRIVSAPLLLPGKPGALPLVCVADSAGVLSLVEVQVDGALLVKKAFPMLGEITSGPFLQMTPDGPRIGCIVGGSRLAWLDPDGDGPLWAHATASGEAIVGRPQLVGGMIVVADQSGRYVGLDPVSGKPLGKGYTLRGSVAPVASPVLFTKDRMLAPLSDGTILLLATARLREK